MTTKHRVDFTITEAFVLGACWAAKDGDESARRVIERWAKTNNKARQIILDFALGKYKRPRGMTKGLQTKKGEWTQHLLLIADEFIADAKAGHYGERGLSKPVSEGTMHAAAWFLYPDADAAGIEQLLNSADADTYQLTKKLLDARRRGRKSRGVSAP
jgi:hypothetical protein